MGQPAWTETVVVPADLQVADLGAARKVWRARYSAMSNALTPTIAGALAIVVGLVLAFFMWPIAVIVALIGAMFLGLGLYFMRGAKKSASAIVEYENGFVALVHKKKIAGPWSAVKSITSNEVFRARTGRTSHGVIAYEIAMTSGETFMLEVWITEIAEIIKMLKARVGPVLLAPLRAEYDAGNDVTFGEVTVSRDAITVDGRLLAWGEIANVSVTHGKLVVTPKDGTKPVEKRVSEIPNIEQLAELIGVKPPLDLRRFG